MSDFNYSTAEETYFVAEEQRRRHELRENMAQAANAARERARIADAVGSDDYSLAERIRALGFDGDSATAFDLMPLVHVAWADGKIQRRERALIFEILEGRGIQAGDPAALMIASLLEEKPSDEFLEETLELLHGLHPDAAQAKDVVELCLEIADSAGGILGLAARVSGSERAVIERVAKELGAEAQESFRKTLR